MKLPQEAWNEYPEADSFVVDGRGLTTDELKGADIAQSLSQDICFGAGSLERLKICVPTFLGVDSAIAMITALRDMISSESAACSS